MVHGGSCLSFVLAPVHISVKDKVDIPVFIYSDDTDIMLADIISLIIAACIPEAENSGHLVSFYIISPQVPLLYKSQDGSCTVRHILDICSSDPQIYLTAADQILLRSQDFFYLPPEIQKDHSGLVVAHTVKLVHLIFFYLSRFILSGNIIGQRDAP